MTEQTVEPEVKTKAVGGVREKGDAPVLLREVTGDEVSRRETGICEFDRVLGGGYVEGSVILVGGDPGIGKSTILLQVCAGLAPQKKCLYISGEESVRQVKLRAKRLGAGDGELYALAETNSNRLADSITAFAPDIVVVDSIQTIYNPEIASIPGSVAQVRDAATRLTRLAKESNITTFIVGHVNKDGGIAGPRILEHIVDTVLYFEGEQNHALRILRAVKNRFGSTNEIGVFDMQPGGMVEVENPSLMLLDGRQTDASGTAVACSMEGTRPILAEAQALVCPTAFGVPRRTAQGFDYNRMTMLLAVMEKKLNYTLYNQDAYVNIAGGVRLIEPACDLALIAAVASAVKGKPCQELPLVGEVGLTGEVRRVGMIEKRIAECAKIGFSGCVVPRACMKDGRAPEGLPDGFRVYGVNHAKQAIDIVL
jgi:DNA repair protein RadA/Sms